MAQSTPFQPTTVLIVENEAMVRLELVGRLTLMGFTALAASDAAEAIVLLDTYPQIEILLTDIKMPGSMDGVRLAHHVRDRWPPVRILVVSGLLDFPPSQLPEGSIFLSKPCSPENMAAALALILKGADPRLPDLPANLRA